MTSCSSSQPPCEIVLTFIDSSNEQKNFVYKTLTGARVKAGNLVGLFPQVFSDGCAVSRSTGDRLFVSGAATVKDIFPDA